MSMQHEWRRLAAAALVLLGAWGSAAQAQSTTTKMAAVPGILPSGLGEAIDRDVARARQATKKFRLADAAVAAGYPAVTNCVEHQPHGAMGLHYQNDRLLDTTLDVEKPEVLVYEKLADGRVKLNGVEYLVPIAAWKSDSPPTIMGQPLKRAERLGIWYLHAWIWEPSPSGLFADWNPRVKCR
jgi:hypothetical protein